AAARAHSESVFNGWIVAFNTELAAKFAGNANVVVVDFYSSFNDEIANPSLYTLQNVKTPACPITGVGSDGLPTYTFATCTDTALSAMTPPAGATGGADWWKSYAFADSFHPTPYGHDLLARYISRSLASAGWL
ncbi:MAG: SGNH/GDSL hydrolase family protein, partial [Rhizobacter sp.]